MANSSLTLSEVELAVDSDKFCKRATHVDENGNVTRSNYVYCGNTVAHDDTQFANARCFKNAKSTSRMRYVTVHAEGELFTGLAVYGETNWICCECGSLAKNPFMDPYTGYQAHMCSPAKMHTICRNCTSTSGNDFTKWTVKSDEFPRRPSDNSDNEDQYQHYTAHSTASMATVTTAEASDDSDPWRISDTDDYDTKYDYYEQMYNLKDSTLSSLHLPIRESQHRPKTRRDTRSESSKATSSTLVKGKTHGRDRGCADDFDNVKDDFPDYCEYSFKLVMRRRYRDDGKDDGTIEYVGNVIDNDG